MGTPALSTAPDPVPWLMRADLRQYRRADRAERWWTVRYVFPQRGPEVSGLIHRDFRPHVPWQAAYCRGEGGVWPTARDAGEAKLFLSRAGAEFFIGLLEDVGPFRFNAFPLGERLGLDDDPLPRY